MQQEYLSLSRKAARHFSYMPLLAVAAGISFLKLLLYARWMEVDEFGLLAKFFVLSNAIGVVGSLGFHLLAHRRVPALLYNNDEENAVLEIVRSGSAAALVGGVVAFCLVVAVLSGYLSSWIWIFALFNGLLNHVFVIFTVESKSRLHMFRYASTVFGRAVISVGLGTVAAFIWNSASSVLIAETVGSFILLAVVIHSVIASLGVEARASFERTLKFSPTVFLPKAHDWKESFIVLLASTAALVSVNIDRWIATGTMTTREFGIYAFAWIAMTAAQSVQQIVNAGFFPIVARTVTASGHRRGLWITGIGSLSVAVVGIAFGIVFSIFAPDLIGRYYPEYSAALIALSILMIAAVLRVSDFWTSFLIIVEQEAMLLKYEIGTSMLTIAGWWGWLATNPPLDWTIKFAMLALSLAIVSYCKSFWLAVRRIQGIS